MQKDTLLKLAGESGNLCITISLNTHRTRPDNAKDKIMLKNLCREAAQRVMEEYGKKDHALILSKLEDIPEEIDISQNLDSLHIFLSSKTYEVVRTAWSTPADIVHINTTFAVRPLIKAFNRSENYLIMLLSQSGVHLFEAINNSIVEEVKNDDFPFASSSYFHTDAKRLSDSKAVDNMVREFLNTVDKAIIRIHNESGLHCVPICTEDNYSRLMQVAGKPEIYYDYSKIDYNNTANHVIAFQAWKIIREIQKDRNASAIADMKAAISKARVLTDLREIYRAAKEGRGDLLIVHQDYIQAVKFNDDNSFDLVSLEKNRDVIDDIVSIIAWEVISKKGRVVFTEQQAFEEIGNMALRLRY